MLDVIEVDCPSCKSRGVGAQCASCDGRRTVKRIACRRCHGSGDEGGRPCLDCRGEKWREIDQPRTFD